MSTSPTKLPEFTISRAPIMWPVNFFQAQEDGPEIEVSLRMRFKRPLSSDTKAYVDARNKRIERERKDLDERFAAPLRKMTQEQRDAIDPGLLSPEMLAAANAVEIGKELTDDERKARLDGIFDADAWRSKWWLGWPADSMKNADGDALNPDSLEHRAYLCEGVPGLEAAVNKAIEEIMTGGRQKNSLPPLAS